MKKSKLIIFFMFILILCGCNKCIESHKEKTMCSRIVGFVRIGNVTVPMTSLYECEKVVCDEYEKDN